jgi:DNA-binding transcriptional regulator YiaG
MKKEKQYPEFAREAIKKLRAESGLTLTAFAEKIGKNRQVVHKWERGETLIKGNTLWEVGNTLGKNEMKICIKKGISFK